MTIWKLISSPPLSGSYNMAIDEMLLSIYKDEKVPILRLYSWNPACVSFGRFQNSSIVQPVKNISYVRRMSGGQAILHDEELTYSLVCSKTDLETFKPHSDFYFTLTQFIINIYKYFNLKPEYAVNSREYYNKTKDKSFICFEGIEQFDITVGGKKIGGNAQYRNKEMVFQHGSIPLSINKELSAQVFQTTSVSEYSTSLEDAGVDTSIDELGKLAEIEFTKTYNVQLSDYVLNTENLEQIEKLKIEKYENTDWTWKRNQKLA
jgi:lipoate-protein ligase A